MDVFIGNISNPCYLHDIKFHSLIHL